MSFRSRVLLVVIAASLVPLALVGLWLTKSATRSGDRFLADRLDGALVATVSLVSTQWVQLRSELLFFAENATVQRVLRESPSSAATDALPELERRFVRLDHVVRSLEIRDVIGDTIWSFQRRRDESAAEAGVGFIDNYGILHQTVPVYERLGGARVGSLDVGIHPSAFLPPAQLPAVTAGMVVALEDSAGSVPVPTTFDATVLSADRFEWAGDQWVTTRHPLDEPSLTVVIAATLGPFLDSFEETAQRGTLVLLGVALLALLVTVVLTTRLTGSLRNLAEAANAVAEGDFDRTIPETRRDEVGAVGRSFNTMTGTLRRTLEQLAGRESLASVGEFAAGLAHEVRNPLTAVQIDLQYVENQLPSGSPLREPQGKALAEIRRLDATVRDALRVARSGRIRATPIDLRKPLQAAVAAASPVLQDRGAKLVFAPFLNEVSFAGDPDALEQLFLNLLMNAAHALDEGGCVEVTLSVSDVDVSVAIRDDGVGMPADVRERAFEPLFSTRGDGTGLGLPIARRIAVAHGGEVQIVSAPGEGSTVEVRLPRAGVHHVLSPASAS